MNRKFLILTEGQTEPVSAKTASCVIRYCPDEVVALLDGTCRGQSSHTLLGVGDVPVVGSLEEAPSAKTLLIGIANPGGLIPTTWRRLIRQAIQGGLDVVSGMHEFLSEDTELAALAQHHQVRLVDVRKTDLQRIARCESLREECLRIHTIGHDCSVGKMVVAMEIARGLQRRGIDAKFAATGQTGIIVEGDGYPIDRMIADFVSGAAEQLVLDHQHHDVLVVEGQGSLVHPSYSGVTLGLLHGSRPHGMVLCYEPGRRSPLRLDHLNIPPLADIRAVYETAAGLISPSRVIGVAMNSRRLDDRQANAERDIVRQQLQLPICDVFRHGPDELIDAVVRLRDDRSKT